MAPGRGRLRARRHGLPGGRRRRCSPQCDDRSGEVRAAAARSLGRLRRPEAALPLVEQPRGTTGYHAALAGTALLDLGAAAAPELRRMPVHEDSPGTVDRDRPCSGLSATPAMPAGRSRRSRDPVRPKCARPRRGRSGASAHRPRSPRCGPPDDRAHFVRAAAALSLGAINARPALPQLLTIARTDRFRPARAAAQAVAAIDPGTLRAAAGEPGAGAHLHEAADLAAL